MMAAETPRRVWLKLLDIGFEAGDRPPATVMIQHRTSGKAVGGRE
jgi:hypothetical protein